MMSILYQYLYTIYNFFFFRKGTIDNKKKYDIDYIIKDYIIKDDIDDKFIEKFKKPLEFFVSELNLPDFINKDDNIIDDIIKDDIIDDKYKQILMKIGDYIVLNEEDINFINTLPNDKLINIIKLYNGSYTETIQCLI